MHRTVGAAMIVIAGIFAAQVLAAQVFAAQLFLRHMPRAAATNCKEAAS